MFPISEIPLMGENIIIFLNKTSQVPIFEYYALLITKFLVIIWNYGKK